MGNTTFTQLGYNTNLLSTVYDTPCHAPSTMNFRWVASDQPWPVAGSFNRTLVRRLGFRERFWVFFAYKKCARPNWDTNSWEEGPSVDTNSLRHLPGRSSNNCDLQFANCNRQTNIFWDNYSIDYMWLTKKLMNWINLISDPNIRVGCLTCLGAIVSTQCPLLEVCHILQPRSLPRISLSSSCNTDSALSIDNPNGSSSLATTPSDSSGSLTPMSTPADGGDTCWMVQMCVSNIEPHLVEESEGAASASEALQPLPVRLESLQLLAQLCKGYFPVMRRVPCSVALEKTLVPQRGRPELASFSRAYIAYAGREGSRAKVRFLKCRLWGNAILRRGFEINVFKVLLWYTEGRGHKRVLCVCSWCW